MLTIKVVVVGSLKESYFREAVAEYQKRLGAGCKCQVIEVAEQRLPNNPSPAQIEAGLKKEGEAILAHAAGCCTVALCIGGRRMSSEGLADFLEKTALATSQVAFVIGSSHGLSAEVVAKADTTLSVSDMTLPHQLCRVVLMEQLYRAFSINTGGKYHK